MILLEKKKAIKECSFGSILKNGGLIYCDRRLMNRQEEGTGMSD